MYGAASGAARGMASTTTTSGSYNYSPVIETGTLPDVLGFSPPQYYSSLLQTPALPTPGLQTPALSSLQQSIGFMVQNGGVPPSPHELDPRSQRQALNVTSNLQNLTSLNTNKSSVALRPGNFYPSRPSSKNESTQASSAAAAVSGISAQQQQTQRDRESVRYATNFPNVVGSMQQSLPPGGTTSYFESPRISVDFQSRPLSPSQSKTYGEGLSHGGQSGGSRKAAAALSNLQGAEQAAQKKRMEELNVPQQRLFAPVDSTAYPTSLQNQSNNSNGPQPPGTLTNMILSNRLSGGIGRPSGLDDSDFGLNQDPLAFGSIFSPDMHRMSVGESPKMGLFPTYGGSYMSQPGGPGPAWQFSHHPHSQSNLSLTTPAFPSGSMIDPSRQQQQQQLQMQESESRRMTKRAPKRSKGGADEDDDEDYSEDESKNKRKKKAAKPADPNEPKITSKHRGVCWYKRTKKWVVQTKVNGKRVHVGYFDDEEKAAEAYKKAVQGIQIKKALEAKLRAATPAGDATGQPALEPGLPIPDAAASSSDAN